MAPTIRSTGNASVPPRIPPRFPWAPPRPVLKMMLWELWRTSRFEFLLRTIGMIAMACLVLYVIQRKQSEVGEGLAAVGNGIVLTMLLAPSLFNASWLQDFDNSRAGFQWRLGFSRPLTTVQLVMVPWLYTSLMGAVSYLIPAITVRCLASPQFPLLVPAVLVAWGNGMFTAVVWSARSRWMKAVLFVAWLTVCGGLLFLHHRIRSTGAPVLLELAEPSYLALGQAHWATLIGSAALAVPLLLASVRRQRHDEGAPRRWLDFAGRSARAPLPPFRVPFLAQLWYERRRLGWPVYWFMLLAPLLPLAFNALAGRADESKIPVVWLVALGLCPLVYMLICSDGMLGLVKKQGVASLSLFDATRPLRNDQMILAKLTMTAMVSLTGWLWMLAVAGFGAWAFGAGEHWRSLADSLRGAAFQLTWTWWMALFVGAVFTYCSAAAMMLGFGMWSVKFHTQLVIGMTVMYAHFVLAVWDYHDRVISAAWSWYGFAAALVLLAWNIRLLSQALVRRSLSPRVLFVFATLWGIQLAATVAAWMHTPLTLPPVGIALAVAGCLTPLAAMAAAPLALASFRHQ